MIVYKMSMNKDAKTKAQRQLQFDIKKMSSFK
jgi:hypothetical protein